MTSKDELLKEVIGLHERERLIEYPFVFRHLEGPRILDVGCLESRLSWALGKLGYEVVGIDLRPYPPDYAIPEGWTFKQCDGRHLPFPDQFFNQVLSVSSTEHIGLLDAYNIKNIVSGYVPSEGGDRENVLEMRRVVKPGGSILLTVPVGYPCHYWMRVYTKETLSKLIEDLTIEVIEYYVEQGPKTWVQSDSEKAFGMESIPLPKACVCLKLRC